MDSLRRGRQGARESAILQLLDEHQEALWRYLRFLGCDAERAEDLLQETFLTVWKKPFDQTSRAASRSYLRTVARNLFLMARRRDRVRLAFSELDEADRCWSRYSEDGGEAYRDALRECLAELSERARRAMQLRYHEGLSREEIGSELGMTVEGAKTLMRRSREVLRECIRRRVES